MTQALRLVIGVLLGISLTVASADAQIPSNLPLIAILDTGPGPGLASLILGFKQALAEHGWVADRTVRFETKVYRVGWLGDVPVKPGQARPLDVFLAGLREGGFVEGQNLIIERRFTEGRRERFPELAAELVRLKVDVIVPTAGRRR